GHLISAYVMARVFGGERSRVKPVHLLARVDQVTTHRSREDRHRLAIGGIVWDLAPAASLALDYQELLANRGSAVTPRKTAFLHLVARF
ncbi:MAG: hypothetical protein WDZ58_02550, partial [Gemmatimonadaceae bacterium]